MLLDKLVYRRTDKIIESQDWELSYVFNNGSPTNFAMSETLSVGDL